jgi:hypothetical protein
MAEMAAAMDKAKVIRLLEFFPDIDEEIRAKRSAIADLDQCYNTVSGIQYDGMPKGNYHAGSLTEKTAMNMPDYISEEIKMYQRQVEVLQKVKIEIIKEVSRLNLKHKKIIFGFYFNCMKWEQVAERTNYSDRQCKNIRDEALGKLLAGFQKNKVLTAYQIEE